jgi:trans-aconitate 2-methyltransferase
MSSWDPTQYLKFADHRLRPALDLLARVPLASPEAVYDLGCGPGNVTTLLAGRWPSARVTGVDSSAAMLDKARALPGIAWQQADLDTWGPAASPDLIFSNAALHWVDRHATLFPRLLRTLKPGGVLAVQMPRQHLNPSHSILFDMVRETRWAALAGATRDNPVATPNDYYAWLAPEAAALDIWETEYQHVLEGENPVLQWFMGSVLRPVLDRLHERDRPEFLADYGARVAAAYPPQDDGRTLLAMRRLFMVVRR